MKISELFKILQGSVLGDVSSNLLLGLDVIPTNKVSGVVIAGNRELIITPRITRKDATFSILSQKGITTVNMVNIIATAAFAALLQWPRRLEQYAYAALSVLKKRNYDLRHLASLFDGLAVSYVLEKEFDVPIEVYAHKFIKKHINSIPIEDLSIVDIFGFGNSYYNKTFRDLGTPITTKNTMQPHIILERILGSGGASLGHGNGVQKFVATLLEPKLARFIHRIRTISRAFSYDDSSKYDFDMNPPDYSYWEQYNIILTDWHKVPENKKKGVFFLVDTSASVSDYELQLFVSEVYSAAQKYTLKGELVWFSGGVEGAVSLSEITSPEITAHGRGGTELAPALKYTANRIEELKLDEAAVVVLSDGGIFDTGAVARVGRVSAGPHIFMYTSQSVEIPGWIVEPFTDN